VWPLCVTQGIIQGVIPGQRAKTVPQPLLQPVEACFLFPSLSISSRLSCESPHQYPTMAPSRNRGWWRSHFHDHHLVYSAKAPESKDSSGKAKVWCMLCFEARIVHEDALDESMVIARTWEVAHSRSAIEDMGKQLHTFTQAFTDSELVR
jgi:hypothetical protein